MHVWALGLSCGRLPPGRAGVVVVVPVVASDSTGPALARPLYAVTPPPFDRPPPDSPPNGPPKICSFFPLTSPFRSFSISGETSKRAIFLVVFEAPIGLSGCCVKRHRLQPRQPVDTGAHFFCDCTCTHDVLNQWHSAVTAFGQD